MEQYFKISFIRICIYVDYTLNFELMILILIVEGQVGTTIPQELQIVGVQKSG